MKNIFLTGEVGIGKTTVLRKVINRTDGFYGGYLGYSVIEDGFKDIRINSLVNLSTKYKLARIDRKKHKPLYVNREIFDDYLSYEIIQSLRNRDILVFDELGRFEENSDKFKSAVHRALDSDKLVLGVLKKHDGDFINSIKNRKDVIVIEVTEENRDDLYLRLLEIIQGMGYSTNTNSYFSWDGFRIEMYDKCIGRKECDYPEVFIKKILNEIDFEEGKTLLDIGTGTGAFFLEFLRKGALCTGVDISLNMLEKLNRNLERENLDASKAKTYFTSFENYKNGNHDIVISAFAAGINKSIELIKKAYSMTNEYLFIIYHHPHDYEKFMASELSEFIGRNLVFDKKKRVKNGVLAKLDEIGLNYEYEEVEFDFPQYIDSIDEGMKLFERFFDIKEEENDKLREFLESKAIKSDSGFVLPEKRKSVFLKIPKV